MTGDAGYIGSHACKVLKKNGYNPIAFDNLSTGWRSAIKFGPFVEGELFIKEHIDEAFKMYRPVAVMHFAAKSEVGESYIKPYAYWENNVLGTSNLVQSAIENNCMNFVFSSICATYGVHDNSRLNENTPQNPKNSYGGSKLSAENVLKNYHDRFGLNFVIFRYFNVAGADPDGEIGEVHLPETHLIPLILDTITGARSRNEIYGTDYNTPDGTCIRDYVHVNDIINAHLFGLRWLENKVTSEIFNLGSNSGFSVKEVLVCIENLTGIKVPVVYGQRRKGDFAKLVSNSNLAKEKLGWHPSSSNSVDIINDAWNWQRNKSY